METLMALRGADLLRVKGFLNIAGCRGRCWCESCSISPTADRVGELAGRKPRQPARVHHRGVPEQQVRICQPAGVHRERQCRAGFARPAARQ
jgi:hypothetical protein